MTLLIDNYDSFSYNLVHAIGVINPNVRIIRNDELSVDEIAALKPARIVISPGPGKPSDAGICIEAVKRFYKEVPILGVCLGHQAIFEAFGGTVSFAKCLVHGKATEASVDAKCVLFNELPPFIMAGRYHSLAGDRSTLPDVLEVVAQTDDGEIMAVKHKEFPVFGLQFHPESILTTLGQKIIENFMGV